MIVYFCGVGFSTLWMERCSMHQPRHTCAKLFPCCCISAYICDCVIFHASFFLQVTHINPVSVLGMQKQAVFSVIVGQDKAQHAGNAGNCCC